MRLPTEIFKQSDASRKAPGGLSAPVAEGEMTREDKKRRRAQRKRAGKAAKRAEGPGQGQEMSQKKEEAMILSKAGKRAKMTTDMDGKSGKSEYGKSSAVFSKLQNEAQGAKAGDGSKKGTKAKDLKGVSSAALRL
jgi:U3 small nucleolar RNA-associated protein MPP10